MKAKLIIAALILSGAVYGGYRYQHQKEQKLIAGSCCGVEGTCSGDKSCTACKNCKYCKHCSQQGGTCGVCKK